jgi:hypothetical protein
MAGVKAHQSTLGALTDKVAEEITAYLSQYFAKQEWISPDKVQLPKFATSPNPIHPFRMLDPFKLC